MSDSGFIFAPPASFVSEEQAQTIAQFALDMLIALEQPGLPKDATESHHGVSERCADRFSVSISMPPKHSPKKAVFVGVTWSGKLSKPSLKRIIAALDNALGEHIDLWGGGGGVGDFLSFVFSRPTPSNLVRAMKLRRELSNKDSNAAFSQIDGDLKFNQWWNRVFVRPHGLREHEVSRSYVGRRKPSNKKRAKGTALALSSGPLREPVPGEYWRLVDPASATPDLLRLLCRSDGGYPDDAVLLVSDVRLVAGTLHSVELRAHPRAASRGCTLSASDFLENFAYAPDGVSVRAREFAALERQIEATTIRAQNGPAPEELLALASGIEEEFGIARGEEHALAVLPAPELLTQEEGSALPVPLQRAAERLESVRTELTLARRRGLWMNQITDHLSALVSDLSGFHYERASAMMATLSDTTALVTTLARGITSLSLYSGEGVEVEQLCAGEGAPASEPLHLMQARLHLDEEYLAHLTTGGADWEDWEDFIEALRGDRQLLERLLPFPRCVALMRFRRTDKEYHVPSKGANMWELIGIAKANDEDNAPNREAFLLVRNGENVFRVFSPIGTSDAERLFPQTDELDRPFHGYDGSRLEFGDVEFYEANEKAEVTALFYRRLLMLMWGLQDRLNIFGTFYDPSRYGETGFMNPMLQAERFRFVADDDATFALGDGSDPFGAWIREKNARMKKGSRVLARWHDLVTPRSCPTAFELRRYSYSHEPMMRVKIAERVGVGVVHTRNGNLCLDVKAKWDTFGVRHGKPVTLHVNLDEASLFSERKGLVGLVLDEVTPEELDRYLRSRIARRNYMEFADLFIEAQKRVKPR